MTIGGDNSSNEMLGLWEREDLKEFKFNVIQRNGNKKVLTIRQDKQLCHGSRPVPSHGHIVWDAAVLLSQYIQSSYFIPPLRNNPIVVELGAGVGLVGMTLASVFPESQVVLTDQEYCTPLLRSNVAANQWSNNKPVVHTLQWGDSKQIASITDSPSSSIDLVVASDILYKESSLEPLIQTLQTLLSSSSSSSRCRFIMAMETRKKSLESQFFSLLVSYGFTWTSVESSTLVSLAQQSLERNQMSLEYIDEMMIYIVYKEVRDLKKVI